MSSQLIFQTRCLSSLSKVFADEAPLEAPYTHATALRGEQFAFQVAYTSNKLLKNIAVDVVSTLGLPFTIRTVGLVPSEMPCYADHDAQVLRTGPGLYPDPLYPLDEMGVTALPGQWRSLWINVELNARVPAGSYALKVMLTSDEGEPLGEEVLELTVLAAALPKQKLLHTEWFHTDCIATYYQVDVFSEEHWRLIGAFIETAVKHGINMILTPIFTPPLDTAIGGERPTVQLIGVEIEDGSIEGDRVYHFDYRKLERWVALCQSKGVEYFEISHLFTQWGAKHTPKIMATYQGEEQRIFGWDTDASGEAYANFLGQLLPDLDRVLRKLGIASCTYFHVSDEPLQEHLETYKNASDLVKKLLPPDYPIIDALTEISYYEQGIVQKPIPSNDHIGPFLEAGIPDLWTYYCCAQYKDVSNRFFNMPSARNRVIGLQLYKFGIQGFLHWGYNFYYAQYAVKQLDPFKVTDALHAFPSGDSFLVYPGEEGPIESIRLEVFYEALQDMRALQLLESFIGKERTVALIEEGLAEPLTFSVYPHSTAWMLDVRERINEAIAACS
ncbi:hypothetical protein A8709_31580 [Paenibacillus pectinilyticus]|uniref:Glycoside hydrolase 123 catalytic domain-containing protein n=1 Tax=Paenibacillus pectinilyticus TaxID=512399 RepID=A0A1C0ZW84_9BACL|nr:DUF4091 domain-containing protein [Paenibacillus pectinilyticus]OCT12371.1 hypothetical protein A8709_31580 [Paenibacillus pectinilyticus]